MRKRRFFVLLGIFWIWGVSFWSINIFSYGHSLGKLINTGLLFESPDEPYFTFINDLEKPTATASEWLRQSEIKKEIIKDKHISRQQYLRIIYKMQLTRVIIASIATLLTFFLLWYGFLIEKKTAET